MYESYESFQMPYLPHEMDYHSELQFWSTMVYYPQEKIMAHLCVPESKMAEIRIADMNVNG